MKKLLSLALLALSLAAPASVLLYYSSGSVLGFSDTQSLNFNSATPSFVNCSSTTLANYQPTTHFTTNGWVKPGSLSNAAWFSTESNSDPFPGILFGMVGSVPYFEMLINVHSNG